MAPRTSQVAIWTDQIIDKLFAAETRRLQNWIDKISIQNQEVHGGDPLAGFLHQGKWYRHSSIGVGKFEKVPLALCLHGEMNSYLSDERITQNEQQLVRQGVLSIIRECHQLQELRDALPDCLADCFPELQALSRTREEAYTIEHDERAKRQFAKIRPKIELYATTRLIF
jgi:hypothetical protein